MTIKSHLLLPKLAYKSSKLEGCHVQEAGSCLKKFKKSIILLAVVFSLFRLGLLFFSNPALEMNVDEERSFQIAENRVAGKGYVYFDTFVNQYVPTAFHSSTPVFIYEFLIRSNVSKRDWVIFINFLTAVVLGFSILYFHKLANFFLDENYSLAATILYCIFPTSIYYVGSLFYYDNIAVGLIVICTFILVKSLKRRISSFDMTIFVTSALVSISLRNQTLPIFGLMLLFYTAVLIIWNKKTQYIPLVLVTVLAMAAVNIPGLLKNYEMFGAYIINNQTGYELLQGHNPHAKGGWNSDWRKPGDPLFVYAHENIPNLDKLNEYEENRARRELAFRFIRENPLSELKLGLKKLALYFFPFNFDTKIVYNPINFLVYSSFVIMLLIKFYKFNFTGDDLLILAPVAGSILLTLVFFMGTRWRYYAESSMVIYTVVFIKSVIDFFRIRGKVLVPEQ